MAKTAKLLHCTCMLDRRATCGEVPGNDGVEEDEQDERQPEEQADDTQDVGLTREGGGRGQGSLFLKPTWDYNLVHNLYIPCIWYSYSHKKKDLANLF